MNLLTLERVHALHTDYFQHVQIDIQPFMRKVVTTWMLEVCEEQQCEEQVFPLAVSYMDRFLAQRAISRQQLQLLAVTSLLLASKFRQCHPLSVDLLCAYTDNSVFPQEVRIAIDRGWCRIVCVFKIEVAGCVWGRRARVRPLHVLGRTAGMLATQRSQSCNEEGAFFGARALRRPRGKGSGSPPC
nr:G1/S-specific cyclin-D2-like [Danaus plexippus plexippus]